MRKRNRRPLYRKIVLKLPDLDHAKSAVLNSLSSLLIREETTGLPGASHKVVRRRYKKTPYLSGGGSLIAIKILLPLKRCGSSFDKLCDFQRLLNHREMTGWQCDRCSVHPLCHSLLQRSGDRLILSGDNEPCRFRSPRGHHRGRR